VYLNYFVLGIGQIWLYKVLLHCKMSWPTKIEQTTLGETSKPKRCQILENFSASQDPPRLGKGYFLVNANFTVFCLEVLPYKQVYMLWRLFSCAGFVLKSNKFHLSTEPGLWTERQDIFYIFLMCNPFSLAWSNTKK